MGKSIETIGLKNISIDFLNNEIQHLFVVQGDTVKIGDLGEVVDGITNSVPYLEFSKSFDEIFGTNDWIRAGTIITVTYK
jgi:hypothetical protein